MNRNEIGVNAGKVWQLLSNNEKWSYGLLKRKSRAHHRPCEQERQPYP